MNLFGKFTALLILSVLLFSCGQDGEEYSFPFQNPEMSTEERVEDVVSRLSLEEKVSLLNYESAAVDSLGIPEYNWWNECLHGVARSGIATVFPQAIGMAATWDKPLINRVAVAISDEGRAKYHDYISKDKRGIYQGITFWTPNINIFRDPRWGRGMETYGECPYLTGSIAVNFINGIQGDDPDYVKCVATAKHYAVHNGPEPLRHEFNADVSEYDFRDTYLPAFRMCVKQANVRSVMCAYNRFRDKPCCGSSPLLETILRDEWGFDGYVVSDCWALNDFYEENDHHVVETKPEAAAMAFQNGTDLNCGNTSPALVDAVKQGLISEEEINTPVKRLFRARFNMGMFDPDERVPYADIPYRVVDCEKHKKLALETARKSIVLLKNEKDILPLDKEVEKVAVIGPNADDVEVLLANYNGIPADPVTPLRGIREKLPDADVQYALGCEHAAKLPTFKPVPSSVLYTNKEKKVSGLAAKYYDNKEWKGDPKHERVDKQIDFYWWDKAPFEDLDGDDFSITWQGALVPPESGEYAIGCKGFHGWNMLIKDGEDTVLYKSDKCVHHALIKYEFVELEKDKTYDVEVNYWDQHGDAEMELLWSKPQKDYEKKALEIAQNSDVVIMFMGLTPRLEGEEMKVKVKGFEGGDRIRIDLPDVQQDLMKKIHKLGKPTVLVLLNGSALAVNWADENMPAIVEAWYPGQSGGTAIADVLFGDYNPAGRLPVTFYKSADDLPPFEDYDMEGHTYRYFREEPLYPFGYGLSYTKFDYGDVIISEDKIASGQSVKVSVDVTNTGDIEGEEVVQLYIKDVESDSPRPIKDLRGYERLNIQPGETKTVTFDVTPDKLAYWNVEQHDYVVEPGEFKLLVGSSSDDNDLKGVSLIVE